jgi:hypothetical protein
VGGVFGLTFGHFDAQIPQPPLDVFPGLEPPELFAL